MGKNRSGEAESRGRGEQRKLDIRDTNDADLVKYGNPDAWKLICKASSEAEGTMESTRAMQFPHGCLVQTETRQKNQDGSWAISQGIAFVERIIIIEDTDIRTGEVTRSLGINK